MVIIFTLLLFACLKVMGGGGVVAHVILVSAQGPNPSFLTLGSVWTGAWTWTRADNIHICTGIPAS